MCYVVVVLKCIYFWEKFLIFFAFFFMDFCGLF